MNRAPVSKSSFLHDLIESLPLVIFARAIGEAFPKVAAFRALARISQPG